MDFALVALQRSFVGEVGRLGIGDTGIVRADVGAEVAVDVFSGSSERGVLQ